MAFYQHAYFLLYYALLPIVLITACTLRINLFSFFYGLFLLFLPFSLSALNSTDLGHPKRFLICLTLSSLIFSFVQVAFNAITWLDFTDEPQFDGCVAVEARLREFGLERVSLEDIPGAVASLAPNVVVFITATLLLIRVLIDEHKKGYGLAEPDDDKATESDGQAQTQLLRIVSTGKWGELMNQIHDGLFCLMLAIAGAIHPSLLSAIYFLLSVALVVCWASDCLPTYAKFRILRLGVLFISGFHVAVIYLYQMPTMRSFCDPLSLVARLFGLVYLKTAECDLQPSERVTIYWQWPQLLSPYVYFLLYSLVAVQLRVVPYTSVLDEKKPDYGNSTSLLAPIQHDGGGESKSLSVSNKKSRIEQLYEIARSQSYVLMLFVMMAWSLLYHSWLTFVLMMLSCIIWMYPDSQRICLKISPYIAIYAQALVLIQFIYGLDLTQSELPDEKPVFLRQIGFEKPRTSAPWRSILLKYAFTVIFWMTVKQRRAEIREGDEEDIKEDTHKDDDAKLDAQTVMRATPTLIGRTVSFLREMITKYWVVVNLCLLLAISVQNPVVIYRIIYMAFFQVFINCFQISFPAWRRSLYKFWTFMVGYCMFVLTLIYTYQFHGFPNLYHNYLGMSEDVLRSIGLERISSGQLVVRLLTPISFLIFTLIQMNFFHGNLMDRTGKWEKAFFHNQSRLATMLGKFHKRQTGLLNVLRGAVSPLAGDNSKKQSGKSPQKATVTIRVDVPEEEHSFPRVKEYIGKIGEQCRQVVTYHDMVVNYAWRFMEIHIDKAIAFLMLHICVNEVSAMNLPYIIYIVVTLPRPRFTRKMSFFAGIWTSMIIVLKMIYQMEFIKEEFLSVDCVDVYGINGTVHAPEWIGLHKTTKVFTYAQDYILLTIVLAFRSIVELRQSLHRYERGEITPVKGVLFTEITREHADRDVTSCIKYLINFFFYRFGLEVCQMTTVIAIGLRSDMVSVIYAAILLSLLALKRERIAQIWPYITIGLAAAFTWQYILCVGIPRAFCQVYPWSEWDHNMIEWMFLPDFKIAPNPIKLYADFFLLLFVSLQLHVFRIEMNEKHYVGGSNESVVEQKKTAGRKTTLKFTSSEKVEEVNNIKETDFICKSDSLLDRIKRVVFVHLYWLTLSIVFVAGTSRVTLFAFGYVLGCFIFLWVGNSLFLKPMRVALALWNNLIIYNVCVIFIKISLQVVGCVYMSQMYKNYCWVLQLLGIACLKTGVRPEKVVDPAILAECNVPHREAGIFYDGMCFLFLLIQRRIFGSEYFKHVVAEIRAQKFIASRGAEIIDKITRKQVEEAEKKEDEILEKVKKKMEQIRLKHERELRQLSDAEMQRDRGLSLQSNEEDFDGLPTQGVSVPGLQHDTGLSRPNNLPISPPKQKHSDISHTTIDPQDESSHVKASSGATAPPSASSSQPSFFTPPDNISVQFPGEDLPQCVTPGRSKSYSSTPRRTDSMSPSRKQKLRFASRGKMEARNSIDIDSSDEWSSGEETTVDANLLEKDVGVKGLGPLQLLNYAFKKGAIKEALKESNEIELAHTRMEREMEDAFGVADHNAIRKAILRQKARRPKADYDEQTFNEESITHREELPSLLRNTLGAGPAPGQPRAKKSAPAKLRRSYSMRSETIPEAQVEERTPSERMDSPPPAISFSRRKSSVHPILENQITVKSPSRTGAIDALAVLEMHVVEKWNRDADQENRRRESIVELSRFQQMKLRLADLARNLGTFAILFGCGCIEAAIESLMSLSRDYRYIARVLTTEKELHKQMIVNVEDESQLRTSISNQSRTLIHRGEMMPHEDSFIKLDRYVESVEEPNTISKAQSKLYQPSVMSLSPRPSHIDTKKRDNVLIRFIQAIYYVLLSRSELICYFMIVLNQMYSASILSMPLPLMTLLWGTLTVPRPSQNFWITMITYTEAMVIVKYIFQFGFFPWNRITASVHPYWPPRIIGIEKKDKYAAWDLALLMALFFHRNILKSIGLWDEKGTVASAQNSRRTSRDRSRRDSTRKSSHIPSTVTETTPVHHSSMESSSNIIPGSPRSQDINATASTRLRSIRSTRLDSNSLSSIQTPEQTRLRRRARRESMASSPKADPTIPLTPTAVMKQPKCSIEVSSTDTDEASPGGTRSTHTKSTNQTPRGSIELHPTDVKHHHNPRHIPRAQSMQIDPSEAQSLFRSHSVKMPHTSDVKFSFTDLHDDDHSSSSSFDLARKFSFMRDAAGHLINKRKVINKTNDRLNAIRQFFSVLLNPVDRFPLDLYAPMFLCDVICFLIIIFGYSGFGADGGGIDGGVASYFEENKVPGTLVSMLILQFVLIILDRAIFLRKFLFAKIVFQVILVIFIHVWMFFLLPAATDRMFVTSFPCKLFYFTKVVYFLISAKQIQAGYPKRCLGNIITNSFTVLNWILYKAFMLMPFLFELRALMDWMWMDTSLGVGDWFMLNDIFSHVSMIKCERNIEEDYPSPKGVKKRPILKYGLGGVLLTAIILIIWFPLVIFSMANTVGTRSLPVECTCKLTVAGFEPLFKSTAQLSDIRELTNYEYDQFQYAYRTSKVAQAYMADYTNLDVVKANINGNSSSRWSISPPSRKAMVQDLRGHQRMSLKFEWYFKRAPDENLQFGTAEDFRVISLEPGDRIRLDLADVISGGSTKLIRISNLLIPLVKVPGEGKSDHVHALLSVHLKKEDDQIGSTFYDALLELDSDQGVEWWKLRMVDPSFDPLIPKDEVVLDNIVLYGFVDKVFPVTFSIITGGGILSLYLSMVLVFGRLMRSIVTGAMQRIMFEELPNVDRILRLCLDIYLVREAGELQLEEDLFAKLVFLFRSPATLIKWTKEKTS